MNDPNSKKCSLCGSPTFTTIEDIKNEEDLESTSFVQLASTFAEELAILDKLMNGKTTAVLPKVRIERPWMYDGTPPPLEVDDAYHIFAWVQKQRRLARSLSIRGEHMFAALVLRSILIRMQQRLHDLNRTEPEVTGKVFDDVKKSWFYSRVHHSEQKTRRVMRDIELVVERDDIRGDVEKVEREIEMATIKARRLLKDVQRIATEGNLQRTLERCSKLEEEIMSKYLFTLSELREIVEEEKDLLRQSITLLTLVKNPDRIVGVTRLDELTSCVSAIDQIVLRGQKLSQRIKTSLEDAREEIRRLEQARKLLDEFEMYVDESERDFDS
ncbi:MAG: hypothetical protein RTU30_12105 [Candidatus Thorarchaeota archaeon]